MREPSELANNMPVVAGQHDQVVAANNTDMSDAAGQAGRNVASDIKQGAEAAWKSITGW